MTKEKKQTGKIALESYITNLRIFFRNKLGGVRPSASSPVGTNSILSDSEKHLLALESAGKFYGIAKSVWNICLLTLPLDFLLIEFSTSISLPPLLLDNLLPLFIFICGLAVAFSFREQVLHLIRSSYSLIKQKPYLKSVCIIVLVAVTAASLVFELLVYSSTSVFSALIQFFVYGAALYSLIGGTNQKSTSVKQYVTLVKRDLFIATILPLLAARLILPLGIITLQVTTSEPGYWTLAALYALTLLALLELAPDQSHFVTTCRRCSVLVPIRLLEPAVCIECNSNIDPSGRY